LARAFVLRPGEGRSIGLGGFRMSVKATQQDTGGAFTLLETDEPPNFGPPLHVHRDAAEAFYVLEGEYILFSRGASIDAQLARSSSFPRASSTVFESGPPRAGS
jgi:hypothetical protein